MLARVVEGIGGAAVIASSLGMLASPSPTRPERAHATGMWGASVGAGIAVGPLLSAGLARLHSWRDVYVVLVAAGVGLALTARGSRSRASEHGARLDLPGVVLLALGMSAAARGLTEGRRGLDASAGRRTCSRPGVVLLAGFVLAERRSTTRCSTSRCSAGRPSPR